MANVYIAVQAVDEALPIVEAIIEDNPQVTVRRYPAMIRLEAPERLSVRRESVSRRIGRDWDPQELHLTLISIGGNVHETDTEFTLQWGPTRQGRSEP